MRTFTPFAVALFLFSGCTRGDSSSPPTTAEARMDFSGVWTGDAGPNLAALKFGAKVELHDDAGTITGEFFNADPEKPGVYLPTGRIQGTRDGGLLLLTTGTVTDMGDAGMLTPQLLILNYDGTKLVGLRRLQLPGRPPVNEYLILRR